MKTITLELRPADAEPILRRHAEHAAKFGAFVDHFTRKTHDRAGTFYVNDPKGFDADRAQWNEKFLHAKRVVESFGIEYEPTSEGETLTVYQWDDTVKSKTVDVGGFKVRHVLKSKVNDKNRLPAYRRGIHEEACRQAADRVVRRWKASLEDALIEAQVATHIAETNAEGERRVDYDEDERGVLNA